MKMSKKIYQKRYICYIKDIKFNVKINSNRIFIK